MNFKPVLINIPAHWYLWTNLGISIQGKANKHGLEQAVVEENKLLATVLT